MAMIIADTDPSTLAAAVHPHAHSTRCHSTQKARAIRLERHFHGETKGTSMAALINSFSPKFQPDQ